MKKTKENFKKFTKEEKIELIDKTFRMLDVGIIALREGIYSIEKFEKYAEIPEEIADAIEKVMLNVYIVSGQFIKNLNNIDLLIVTMLMEGGLSEREYNKYADKICALMDEYDSFKSERSATLQGLMA